MPSRRALALAAVLALGCRDKPTASGERVELTTTVVDQVCAGTLAHLDAEVERIEAALDLEPTDEPARILIVGPEDIERFCERGATACVEQDPRRLYISTEIFQTNIRYELVRDRLAKTSIGASKPLFYEGVAANLTYPSCAMQDSWTPDLSKALGASTRNSLGKEGRYLGGELVGWLLETRGPAALFELMRAVERNDSADTVRVKYMQTIGGSIDAELLAHWRPDFPLDAARADCNAPELEPEPGSTPLLLTTELDCDSPRVRNDFEDHSRVFVEWSLTVDQDGSWTLLDPLPEGVSLVLEKCRCFYEVWSDPIGAFFSQPFELFAGKTQWLTSGRYRVRAYGPLGASLDIRLQGPCDFVAQDCPDGRQCTADGACLEQVDDPAQLGEPCWPAFGEIDIALPCDVGLTCIGTPTLEGICLPACAEGGPSCEAGLSCFGTFCSTECDPFAATCEADWNCYANLATGVGACVPAATQLGLLESCSLLDFSCASGLSCETVPGIDGCHNPDPDAWFDFSGCCVPICDPAAPDPGCPAELPSCVVHHEDDALGTCQP